MLTRKQCFELYIVALKEIERATGDKIYFRNAVGCDVVDKMLEKAKELNL